MRLEVFFDYACPFCYVGLHYLKELLPSYPGIEVCWRPCEAHPEPEPRVVFSPSEWWEALLAVAREEGIELNEPVSPLPRSALAFQGMFHVESMSGDVEAYNNSVFDAAFIRSEDIEKASVLKKCAAAAGIGEAPFELSLGIGEYSGKMRDANVYAYQHALVQAVPTFIMNGKRLDSAPGIGVTKQELGIFLENASRT